MEDTCILKENVSIRLFASKEEYLASDFYNDGASEALRRRVKEAINVHRASSGLLPYGGCTYDSSSLTLDGKMTAGEIARRICDDLRGNHPHYLVVAVCPKLWAQAIADSVRLLLKERGVDIPAVIAIEAPQILRFQVGLVG